MNTPILECAHLSRALDSTENGKILLDDVSFRLERGQVLAVLGPSGSGKTTLLRLLNRLDEPTGGTVLLHGDDYRTLDPRELRRRIGMVMQRAYLFPGTAASNIRYGPEQHGLTMADAEIDRLLEHVGLADYRERDVATLSGGEAQRVSIARSLANEPEILLLDEPTSALDEGSKQDVERLLATVVRERRATCVWVTHDLAQARRVSDMVLKIEAARAVGPGTPQELLDA